MDRYYEEEKVFSMEKRRTDQVLVNKNFLLVLFALVIVLVIVSAGVLTAIVTAYCGPIIFLGLAVPHLARAMFQTSDHRTLMPATLLLGAALALICNLLARMPGFEGALPVNSVTALVGAPVVASVLFNKRKNDWNE